MAPSNLLRFPEAVSLGLHAMCLLARCSDKRFSTQQLARFLGGSAHHLAKVMQRLTKVGLTDSVAGPQGGFRLARPAHQVRLLEVYETLEGPLELLMPAQSMIVIHRRIPAEAAGIRLPRCRRTVIGCAAFNRSLFVKSPCLRSPRVPAG